MLAYFIAPFPVWKAWIPAFLLITSIHRIQTPSISPRAQSKQGGSHGNTNPRRKSFNCQCLSPSEFCWFQSVKSPVYKHHKQNPEKTCELGAAFFARNIRIFFSFRWKFSSEKNTRSQKNQSHWHYVYSMDVFSWRESCCLRVIHLCGMKNGAAAKSTSLSLSTVVSISSRSQKRKTYTSARKNFPRLSTNHTQDVSLSRFAVFFPTQGVCCSPWLHVTHCCLLRKGTQHVQTKSFT